MKAGNVDWLRDTRTRWQAGAKIHECNKPLSDFLTAQLQIKLLNPSFSSSCKRYQSLLFSRLHSVLFPQKRNSFPPISCFSRSIQTCPSLLYKIKTSKLHGTLLPSLPSIPHTLTITNILSVASMSSSWFPTSDHSFPISVSVPGQS